MKRYLWFTEKDRLIEITALKNRRSGNSKKNTRGYSWMKLISDDQTGN